MTDYISKWTEFALGRGTRLLTILIIAIVLIRLLRTLTRRLVRNAGSEGTGRVARMREQQTQTFAGMLYSGGTAVVLIVSVLTALPEFGFNVTPVAAAAGLASLAVGFGAQHLVRDFINGFFTVFEDQYVVGDIVRIGDVVGRVEHLTLRRTVVRDAQGCAGHHPQRRNRQGGQSQPRLGATIPGRSGGPDQPLSDALTALESRRQRLSVRYGMVADAGRWPARAGRGVADAELARRFACKYARFQPGKTMSPANCAGASKTNLPRAASRWAAVQRVQLVGANAAEERSVQA